MGKRQRRQQREFQPRLDELVAECEAEGWTVVFQPYVEDSETPGMLGFWAGMCLHDKKKIKVQTAARSLEQQVVILEHEMEHMRGLEWATDHELFGLRCGGRVSGGVLANKRPGS